MDFSVIFQLRTKKFWWMDVIFYFVVSLLVATIFCYIIFLIKNNIQRDEIKKEEAALQTVGTFQQKEYEKEVINYRSKINDFNEFFKNHQFASNMFAFIQAQSMQNVWFKQFNLDEKNNAVQLSGESDDMGTFSRQVKIFENENSKKYIKSIGTLNSSLGESARVEFNIDLALDQSIFSYLSSLPLIAETAKSEQPSNQEKTEQGGETATEPAKSIEKLITSFHLLLDPEIVGNIDQTNYVINLSVPFSTDLKNLTPAIVVSSGATVAPESHVVQDFAGPIIYTVSAEDGSTQVYRVVVSVLPEAVKQSNKSNLGIWIFIIIIIVIASGGLALFFWLQRKNKKINI